MLERKVQGYGWRKDLPDGRDFAYAAPLDVLAALPTHVDLRGSMPPVYDQGQLGSCTANAIGGALEFDQIKQYEKNPFVPSRLFIYYNERVIEHSVNSDAGAEIRDGVKSVSKQGVCPENEWPYDISKFADKPPHTAYVDATKFKAITYAKVNQNLGQFKGCLAAGYPFILGFTVYESFESDQVAETGKVPMPRDDEQMLGGHAVLAVGYDEVTQRFIVRNSWGKDWGHNGYFSMPYPYLLQSSLSSDFWTIRTVS